MHTQAHRSFICVEFQTCRVKFTRGVNTGELSQMDAEEKNFSGPQADELFARASEKKKELAGTTECSGRKAEEEREETGREYESGQELLRQRVYEVPVDRMPSKRGREGCTLLVFERRKALSCRVCDSNNESKPSQSPTYRTFYRGNVNVIPVCAISRRRSIFRRITAAFNNIESISISIDRSLMFSFPTRASTQKTLFHRKDIILLKNETVVKYVI